MVNVRVKPSPKKPAVWQPLQKTLRTHRAAPQLDGRNVNVVISPRSKVHGGRASRDNDRAARMQVVQSGTSAGASSIDHAASQVPAMANVATQQTQTTEFLRYFEERRQEGRATARAEMKAVDEDIQARVLADRQILHRMLEPHRRPGPRCAGPAFSGAAPRLGPGTGTS